ncbi:hypothetical protein YK56LOC_51670 [Caballeronia sp. HLA56]
MRRLAPVFDDDARRFLPRERDIDFRAQCVENLEIIDQQPHTPAVLAAQLAREPPAHADVAEIVDDRAEDVASELAVGLVAGLLPMMCR